MKKAAKILISVVLTVTLCYLVWRSLDLKALVKVLKDIDGFWLTDAIAVFMSYQVLRAFRFKLLINANAKAVPSLISTMCWHGFFNNVLPLGLGESSLVLLLRGLHHVPLTSGVALLLTVRVLDLAIFVILFLAIAVFWIQLIPSQFILVMVGVLAALAILVGIGLYLVGYGGVHFQTSTSTLRGRIHDLAKRFRTAIQEVKQKRIWLPLILYSTAMWAAMYFFMFCTIYALNYHLSFFVVLMLYLLVFPVNLLPIKGVGNFGTHEAAWYISLQIMGVQSTDAAILGYGSHLIYLSIILLSAVLGSILYLSTKGLMAPSNGTAGDPDNVSVSKGITSS